MKRYEYGRIAKLAECLEIAGVDPGVVAEIMLDGESIRSSTPPVKKAAWMKDAMQRMNRLLERPTRLAVREACACCLGGQRLELSKQIFREGITLEERITAANQAKLVFGHSVELLADGQILVRFAAEGRTDNRCVCLPKAAEPISITYCYCCGGHVKHHLQIATGLKLAVTVRSSALSSGGRLPCSFLFQAGDN